MDLIAMNEMVLIQITLIFKEITSTLDSHKCDQGFPHVYAPTNHYSQKISIRLKSYLNVDL